MRPRPTRVDPWWDEVDNRFEARLALQAASKAARAARRAEQETTGRPWTDSRAGAGERALVCATDVANVGVRRRGR